MARISDALIELTTPKYDMMAIVYDQDDGIDKKIQYENLMQPLSGSGSPGVTPDFIGQRYIDTTGNREYFAVGTSTSADWRKVAIYEYGTVTVIGGGGDVTVNLPFDWTDGKLDVVHSTNSANWCEAVVGTVTLSQTSYDALINAAYTNAQILIHSFGGGHTFVNKTVNASGIPKSATATSITFDDDGVNTIYIKYMITA